MPSTTSTLSHDITTLVVVVYAVLAVVLLVLIGIPVILLVANRAEPDQRGLRPFTVYLYALSFIAVLAGYLGSVLIVSGIVKLFTPHYFPVADSVAQQVLVGAIIVGVAALVLRYHLRRGIEISRTDDSVDGPNARILHTYVSAVSFFVSSIVILVSAVAIYELFDLIGPGVFGGSGRGSAGRQLIELVVIAVIGAAIVLAHLRYGPPRLLPGPFQPQAPRPGGAPGAMPPGMPGGLPPQMPLQPQPYQPQPYQQPQPQPQAPAPQAEAPLPPFGGAPTAPAAPAPAAPVYAPPVAPAPTPAPPSWDPAPVQAPPPPPVAPPAPPYQAPAAPPPPAPAYPTTPVAPTEDEGPSPLPPFS